MNINSVATLPFVSLDDSDGKTPLTGGTPGDFTISYKNPAVATMVATVQTTLEFGSGHYGAVFSSGMVGTDGDDWFHYHVLGTIGTLPIRRFYAAEWLDTGTVDRVNSVPDPSAGTIDLAVQVNNVIAATVTAGTVERANSVPFQNPTGGTVDLAVQANTIANQWNPSGGTVDLAVQTNLAKDLETGTLAKGTLDLVINAPSANPTGGTVDLVINAPSANPTGGTVELAIQANTIANQWNPSGGTVDLVTSITNQWNPSGGTVDLSVQTNNAVAATVTAGTAERVNSIPAITDGTIGLVNSLAAAAYTSIASAVFTGSINPHVAAGNFAKYMQYLAAAMFGGVTTGSASGTGTMKLLSVEDGSTDLGSMTFTGTVPDRVRDRVSNWS